MLENFNSIPTQLAQKFSASAFTGNLQLCGFSDSIPCPIAPSPFGPETPRKKRHHRLSIKDIILIAAGVLLLVLLVLCFILLCILVWKRAAAKAKDGPAAAGRPATGRGEKCVPPTAGEVEAAVGEAGGKLVHFDGPMVFATNNLLCATAEIMGEEHLQNSV